MRKPFKRNLADVAIEKAHGGSGKRQLILSEKDDVSLHLKAMTKGYLAPNATFEWHDHNKVDEYFLVLKGTGVIRFKDNKKITYQKDDLVYIPANISHEIENTGGIENEFYFIRIDA